MVDTLKKNPRPFSLVITGEAQSWLPALRTIVGPQWLITYQVRSQGDLLDVVREGLADAAVLDDAAEVGLEAIQLLRMIRRLNAMLPVVLLTSHAERRWMENALRLAAFSVVTKPLELEELLRQIRRMMQRVDGRLRGDMRDF